MKASSWATRGSAAQNAMSNWISGPKCLPHVLSGRHARLSGRYARRIEIPFTLNPDLPVRKKLLLPDGHQSFEPVDSLQSRIESGAAVRSGGNDGNARLADLHAAQPMQHGDTADREIAHNLPP